MAQSQANISTGSSAGGSSGGPNFGHFKAAISTAKFGMQIMNSDSAYSESVNTARQNIALAQNNINDTLYRGRQAQLERESEGISAAGQSSLNLAAQGMDVSGSLGQAVSGSYEAVGALNGAREMINAYRESLGYEIEQANYGYQIDMAAVNRQTERMNAAMDLVGGLAQAYS